MDLKIINAYYAHWVVYILILILNWEHARISVEFNIICIPTSVSPVIHHAKIVMMIHNIIALAVMIHII